VATIDMGLKEGEGWCCAPFAERWEPI